MYQQKDKIQNLILLALDTICMIASYFLAGLFWYQLYRGVSFARMLAELSGDFGILIVAYAVMVVFFNYNEKYMQRGKLEELKAVVKMNVLLAAIISMIEFARHETSPMSRGISFATVLVNVCLMYAAHLLLKKYLLSVYKNKASTSQMLLLTTVDRAEDILRSVAREREWTKRITGIIIVDDYLIGKEICGVPVVAGYDDMLEYARKQIVDEIFIIVPYDTGESLYNVVMEFENMGARVHLTVEILNRFKDFNVALDSMGDIPVISFYNNYYDYRKILMKRLMDIVGSLVGIVFTVIIGIIIAPPLLIESPGPLIFKQKRVGRNGRYFYMYKFRSMAVQSAAKEKSQWTTPGDPRVTPIGRFIRKTSIDELPQLFNVLKGDMSLVGPRPERPFFVEKFKEEIPRYMIKHQVRPGMTGWAQVNGYRGDTSITKRIEHDLYYIENWTLGFDFKIMFLTVFKGFINKNAY